MSKVARQLTKNQIRQKKTCDSKPTIVTRACCCIEHEALSVLLLVLFVLLDKQLQGTHLLHLTSTGSRHDVPLHPLNVGVGAVTAHTAVEPLVRKPVETVASRRKADGSLVHAGSILRTQFLKKRKKPTSPGRGLAAPMEHIGNPLLLRRKPPTCTSRKPPVGTFCPLRPFRENLSFQSSSSTLSFCNCLFRNPCKETACECKVLLHCCYSLGFYSNSSLKSQFDCWSSLQPGRFSPC